MNDYILAFLLITGPVEPPPDIHYLQSFLAQVQKVAIDLEIGERNDWVHNTCKTYWNRYQELKDEITLSEAIATWPLPSYAQCVEYKNLSKVYKERFIDLWYLCPNNSYLCQEAIEYCNKAYVVWDNLADIQAGSTYNIYHKRLALKLLISEIGLPAFYNRQFPSPIPTWLLRSID